MQNNIQTNKNIKRLITVVLLVMVFFLGGITLVMKKNHENILVRDNEIDRLINDVNSLKKQNDLLQENLIEHSKDLKNLYTYVSVLNKDLNSSKENYSSIQKNLQDQIDEKELAIGELVQNNLKLKNELQVTPVKGDIQSFLIIGQNKGLTDTMIIASVNPENKTVTLVSIPRDLFYKGHKINEIYAFYGIDKLEESIYDVSGISPQKYAMFDFGSFEKIIDVIDGVDIDVKRSFTDTMYPGPDFSYRKVSFTKGLHHMNGAVALMYARSRESTSDFDRSARQQQVIAAIKDKIMNLNLISALPAYASLYDEIQSKIKTDIGFFDAFSYYDQYKSYKFVTGNVISSGNFLYSKISNSGQYILLPAGGSYAKIKKYISDLINA
jgi:LCP family protein required for cell wall assembly